MRDIEIAKNHLLQNNLSMVIVRDGEIIEVSNDKGIKPLFEVYSQRKEFLSGSAVADRVIGKAAAMILKYGGVKILYTDIISKAAEHILESSNISIEYKEIVQVVLNREGNGMCPIENLAVQTDDIVKLISDIRIFISKKVK